MTLSRSGSGGARPGSIQPSAVATHCSGLIAILCIFRPHSAGFGAFTRAGQPHDGGPPGGVLDRAERLEDVEGEPSVRAMRPALDRVGQVAHAQTAANLFASADG